MDQTYDKYFLVTGGAGFIGSHFLNTFVPKYKNYHFLCIDRLSYASNYGYIENLEKFKNYKFIKLDLSTVEVPDLLELFKKYKTSYIINFAAETSVDRSFKDPLLFTKNNILSTQNLLECTRLLRYQIDLFFHVSTDEVYGNGRLHANEVSTTLEPTNPYAATKASIDLILNAYSTSYLLPIMIIRSNNIYGPGQNPEKLIPLCIENGLASRPIPIHGNGENIRVFLYITDILDAVDLHSKYSYESIYNIGVRDPEYIYYLENNIDLVKLIGEIFEFEPQIEFVKDRLYNDFSYSLDCSRIYEMGWRPKVELREGLEKLRDYYIVQ
ncbi:GAL102 [Candida jiufengensis]|uniref:GAL102 n=1 Tax=Candida jiufengensis TaxID=497108 RepID=UPI0022257ACF|nr:GAL102 [Candida jiufengensis]KAI5953318.1 GAL102 [Candida jiufengensis]